MGEKDCMSGDCNSLSGGVAEQGRSRLDSSKETVTIKIAVLITEVVKGPASSFGY